MRRAPRRNPATAVVPAPLVRPDGGPVAAGADGAGDVDLLPHASSHHAGGSDALSVLALGGYPGGTTDFLRADGSFAAPPSAVGLTQPQVLARASLRG